MRCVCGYDNPASSSFCQRCGRSISETAGVNGYSGQNNGYVIEPKKKSKAGIIVALVAAFTVVLILVLGIAGGLGYYFFFGRTAKQNNSVSVSTEEYNETAAAEIMVDDISETVQEYPYEEDYPVNVTPTSTLDDMQTDISADREPESSAPQPEQEPGVDEYELSSAEYMCPNSATVLLTEDDLEGFDKWDCIYARNEIYARHGRKFKNDQVREYFEAKSWYSGTIDPEDFSDSVFSQVELDNIAFIVSYEKKKGYK